MDLFDSVLFSAGLSVGKYVSAVRLVDVEQTACKELDPGADKLFGSPNLSSGNDVSQLKMCLSRSPGGIHNRAC